MFKSIATLNPVEGADVYTFALKNLRGMENGLDVKEEYYESCLLVTYPDSHDVLKVVPTFLSPGGFTGFCYGPADEVDNDEVDPDTYLIEAEQMAAVVTAAIKSHGGFKSIVVGIETYGG